MGARVRLAVLCLGAALGPLPAAGESPAVDYMLQCQGCHLPDGSGSPGEVPALGGQVARFTTVPGGRAYLVQVPGSAASPLDDARLAAVLNWMVRRFGPPEAAARFTPYTAEEVARHRGRPLIDVAGVRAALLAELAAR